MDNNIFLRDEEEILKNNELEKDRDKIAQCMKLYPVSFKNIYNVFIKDKRDVCENILKVFGEWKLAGRDDVSFIENKYSELNIIRLKVSEFVSVLFEGVVDKGGHPYIKHLSAVENKVIVSYECRIVALLHDVLEDTDKTEDDLKELGVPEYLIDSVKRLTRLDGVTYNDYIDELLESNDIIALRVKTADLEHNMDIRRIPNPTQKDYDRVEKRYKPVYEKVCRKLEEIIV